MLDMQVLLSLRVFDGLNRKLFLAFVKTLALFVVGLSILSLVIKKLHIEITCITKGLPRQVWDGRFGIPFHKFEKRRLRHIYVILS